VPYRRSVVPRNDGDSVTVDVLSADEERLGKTVDSAWSGTRWASNLSPATKLSALVDLATWAMKAARNVS